MKYIRTKDGIFDKVDETLVLASKPPKYDLCKNEWERRVGIIMIYQMICCLICLALCMATMVVNIFVYWKINKALKNASEKGELWVKRNIQNANVVLITH